MPGMGKERTQSARGDLPGVPADIPGGSGWIKTRVAAEALGVDPRTVRSYIERGDLVARSEGEGIQKTYLVSIDSVYALRDSRSPSAKKRRMSAAEGREISARDASSPGARGSSVGVPAEDLADIIRDLAADTARMSAEAAEFRTRLELTTQTESTLRETLERERERADRLEAELASLREARKPVPAPRDTPETVSESMQGTTNIPTDRGDRETAASPPPEPRRASWWRRFFGFE